MAKRKHPVTLQDVGRIRAVVERLRGCRDELKACHARQAARYVSRCIKSAEGALHHAERMICHTCHGQGVVPGPSLSAEIAPSIVMESQDFGGTRPCPTCCPTENA